jgi:hypothetical protein
MDRGLSHVPFVRATQRVIFLRLVEKKKGVYVAWLRVF